MRIARFQAADGPRYGLLDGDVLRPLDLDATAPTPDLLAAGHLTGPRPNGPDVPLADARLLAPVHRPGKVAAIGLNYVDHAAEAGRALPAEPLVFAKFPSSIVGPDVPIRWDRGLTDGVDFEAELAVVIGRSARCVTREAALDHVAFYTCLNDVSARDLQFSDGQWVRAKSLDTFCPIGPWLVSADEVGDPGSLAISCTVSGERLQDASTGDLIFDVPELIARLSQAFTLEPGDVIATGTPPGVGWFRDPRRPLRHGDQVVVSIERIGDLRNPVEVTGTPRATG